LPNKSQSDFNGSGSKNGKRRINSIYLFVFLFVCLFLCMYVSVHARAAVCRGR